MRVLLHILICLALGLVGFIQGKWIRASLLF
jgi:hypothetical protein